MEENEDIIKRISNMILTNPQKMIREEDLRTICINSDFDDIMSKVFVNLSNVGFVLIKTNFFDQGYYVLTTDGIDDTITPSQYGILALIAALGKELEENIPIKDLKEIFNDVWNTDVKFLIESDYLRKNDDFEIIRITPLGKAILKNVFQDLRLNNLLKIFNDK